MKRFALLTLALLAISSVAFAQIGSIGLFADATGGDCNISGAAGLATVFVVHVNTIGATASRFQVVPPPGFVYVADQLQAPTLGIGTSAGGGDYAYTQCRQGPIHFLSILYSSTGATPACTRMTVTPRPGDAFVQMVDCNDALFEVPLGGTGIVNSDVTCNCDVPVETSTWGAVKALYN